jgi:phosphoglucosamine mutase
VAVADPSRLAEAEAVWQAVALVESELGQTGRVLLRPSGTEPLVRVMVEATTAEQADEVARRLGGVVEASLAPADPARATGDR